QWSADQTQGISASRTSGQTTARGGTRPSSQSYLVATARYDKLGVRYEATVVVAVINEWL
ncbi:hypothetical protein P3T39_005206, partial [Kitasatospora sp. GP82]|nr:hypothetical protein [Kitasatospora sp. GP82]